MTAAEQLMSSAALKAVLLKVLALGNYLNGTSARGGAYGFKLSDLPKLVQARRRQRQRQRLPRSPRAPISPTPLSPTPRVAHL